MEKFLNSPIKLIKGVGEARAEKMKKLGIEMLCDILEYYPRTYEDRTRISQIKDLKDGINCTVFAKVMSDISVNRPRYNLAVYKTVVADETSSMTVVWFNLGYVRKNINKGEKYCFFGKVKRTGNRIEMINPVYEKAKNEKRYTLKIFPIYKLTEGLTQTYFRNAVKEALKMINGKVKDILPDEIRNRYHLSEINYCYENIHFPKTFKDLEMARRRLVFEELLLMQLGILSLKGGRYKKENGISFLPVPEVDECINSLPFKLTKAQKKALGEILGDMAKSTQMNRLLQGDVGSGKTIVALLAMLTAVKNGYQAAFLVPTEILAEQHMKNIEPVMAKFNISCLLLTGSLNITEKKRIKEKIKSGEVQVIVGTHAILQKDVVFNSLGLVVTDEQHRFGVKQRACLSNKAQNPDILVMSATPIPRTLGLILYGDLDISIIDELPPGRKEIKTYVVDESMRERINKFIRREIKAGRQAYIVCPLIDESEAVEAESVLGLIEKIKARDFREFSVGVIHGRMRPLEKENTMRDFASGKLDILVSTTVIEVGVDVSNATIMVIENAERFGLAQLHQLRGRVGRGRYQSYCILYNQSKSETSRKRLEIMQKTGNGFEISEKDLEIRGVGDFFGTRQHGLPELKIANLYEDIDILKLAQKVAFEIIDMQKLNKKPEYERLKQKILKRFEEKMKEIVYN